MTTLSIAFDYKGRRIVISSQYTRRRDSIRGLSRILNAYNGKIISCSIRVNSDMYKLKSIKGGVVTFYNTTGLHSAITYKFPNKDVRYEKS